MFTFRTSLFILLTPACEPVDATLDESAGVIGTEETERLTFDIDGATEGTALTLTWVRDTGEGLEIGNLLAATIVDSDSQSIDVPVPDESEMVEVEPLMAPGLFMATYLPALHTDNGNAIHDNDEFYVGVGDIWPTYVQGTIPDDVADAGLHEGWNALLLNEGYIEIGVQTYEIPMAVNLAADNTITIGGDYSGETDPEDLNLALEPMTNTTDSKWDSLIYDGHLTDSWEINIEGAPPEDHLVDWEDQPFKVAAEAPVAYSDEDASGSMNGPDQVVNIACYKNEPVTLYYAAGTTDLETAYEFTAYDIRFGWMAAASSAENGDRLNETEASQLTMSDDCSAE